jgi:hypothetical protein
VRASHCAQDDAAAKAAFKCWFNHALKLMVPLIGATAAASCTAFVNTREQAHLVSAVLVGCVPLYTRAVLMPSIHQLRDDSKHTAAAPLKRWAKLHHVRTGLALSALGFTLLALRRRN